VLILHGATFPSRNAAAWKIEGRSWMDELSDAGHEVYALDFLGYGESDRYAEMKNDDSDAAPLGDVASMTVQVERAVEQIRAEHGGARVHLIAHSAGTFAAALYAQSHADALAHLVLFGPPNSSTHASSVASKSMAQPSYRHVSVEDQLQSFESKVIAAGRLEPRMFETWGAAYLATDPSSGKRQPQSVRIPGGMHTASEALDRGAPLPYDPTHIATPTLVIVGDWDAVTPPAECLLLFEQFASPMKRFVIISEAGHRMHLEKSRGQLFREVNAFLEETVNAKD
jgi:pimeloyl-ACP methyl ester carboxylesterase